jgi:hypothetical protein
MDSNESQIACLFYDEFICPFYDGKINDEENYNDEESSNDEENSNDEESSQDEVFQSFHNHKNNIISVKLVFRLAALTIKLEKRDKNLKKLSDLIKSDFDDDSLKTLIAMLANHAEFDSTKFLRDLQNFYINNLNISTLLNCHQVEIKLKEIFQLLKKFGCPKLAKVFITKVIYDIPLSISSEFLELISKFEWSSLIECFCLDEKRINDSNIRFFCEIIQVS